MTAKEFEQGVDRFFATLGGVIVDILQFIVVFIMYISPVLIILPLYNIVDMSHIYYEITITFLCIISFGITVWHWFQLSSDG